MLLDAGGAAWRSTAGSSVGQRVGRAPGTRALFVWISALRASGSLEGPKGSRILRSAHCWLLRQGAKLDWLLCGRHSNKTPPCSRPLALRHPAAPGGRSTRWPPANCTRHPRVSCSPACIREDQVDEGLVLVAPSQRHNARGQAAAKHVVKRHLCTHLQVCEGRGAWQGWHLLVT